MGKLQVLGGPWHISGNLLLFGEFLGQPLATYAVSIQKQRFVFGDCKFDITLVSKSCNHDGPNHGSRRIVMSTIRG
jgi:hypothetical protein